MTVAIAAAPKMGLLPSPSSSSSSSSSLGFATAPEMPWRSASLTIQVTGTASSPPSLLPSDMLRAAAMATPNNHHNATPVMLPKLRIPTESDMSANHPSHAWLQQQVNSVPPLQPFPQTSSVPSSAQYQSAVTKQVSGPLTRSPSSPAAFFEDPENKFGLTHLLEAAEQCLPVPVATHSSDNNGSMYQQHQMRKRSFSDREPQQQSSPYYQDQLPPMAHKMHSIGYLVDDDEARSKRLRPELPVNFHPSFGGLSLQPQTPHQQQHYQSSMPTTSEFHSPVSHSSPHSTGSGSCSPSGVAMPSMVWETVLTSGKFPSDVCLSENSSASNNKNNESTMAADNLVIKQGRWTCDEKEFAEALIQSVRSGEAVLPPNVSLRKFIADNLQCKAMRVSKKFRSLRSCHSPTPSNGSSPTECDTPREKSFNPLSLRSIMNNEASNEYESVASNQYDESEYHQAESYSGSKKAAASTQRVLKRSDYSQHGMVRSGRWSLEEENYAKAMIEAFKAGYLPLHGNVSLRKFLSEVLVCHPMRISKKFVGYVRKYHWYRIAAGKCDPEAKQAALEQLCHLERAFWASMQQSNDWSMAAAAAQNDE